MYFTRILRCTYTHAYACTFALPCIMYAFFGVSRFQVSVKSELEVAVIAEATVALQRLFQAPQLAMDDNSRLQLLVLAGTQHPNFRRFVDERGRMLHCVHHPKQLAILRALDEHPAISLLQGIVAPLVRFRAFSIDFDPAPLSCRVPILGG